MILTIMNCEECGSDLREWDFLKKRARLIENRPYCTVCRPFGKALRAPGEPLPNGARTLPRNRHLL